MTLFTLTAHDPTSLSLAGRLEVARFTGLCHAFANPDDPPLVIASQAEDLKQQTGDERTLLLLARQEGTLVGQAMMFYDLCQNTDKAHLHVGVHPDFRRRGVGQRLLSSLSQEALKLGRTTYTAATTTRSPAGEAFAGRMGASASLPSIVSDLALEGLDQAQLAAWVDRPANDPYRLHRFRHLPEHELGRVANVVAVMNTAPRGDLDFEDWVITPEMVGSWQQASEATGKLRMFYAAEHLPSAEFVAFTEVEWHPERASLVNQQGTGVRPDHRGHGLGKWLKAAVLLDLPTHNPQARMVRTGNADSNAAMLGINRALGFAPAFGRTEWQGQVHELIQASRSGQIKDVETTS